ncbi:hypothetical protein MTO96_050150, partial [Rhipicephalus appendiculatus]
PLANHQYHGDSGVLSYRHTSTPRRGTLRRSTRRRCCSTPWGSRGWNHYLRVVEDEPQPASGVVEPRTPYIGVLGDASCWTPFYDEQPRPDVAYAQHSRHYGKARTSLLCNLFLRSEGSLVFAILAPLLKHPMFDQIVAGIASPHLKRKFLHDGPGNSQYKRLWTSRRKRNSVDRALQRVCVATIDAAFPSRPTRQRRRLSVAHGKKQVNMATVFPPPFEALLSACGWSVRMMVNKPCW